MKLDFYDGSRQLGLFWRKFEINLDFVDGSRFLG